MEQYNLFHIVGLYCSMHMRFAVFDASIIAKANPGSMASFFIGIFPILSLFVSKSGKRPLA